REILYKVLFDMQRDVNDLKKLTLELLKSGDAENVQKEHSGLIKKIYTPQEEDSFEELTDIMDENDAQNDVEILEVRNSENHPEAKDKYYFAEEIEEEETL